MGRRTRHKRPETTKPLAERMKTPLVETNRRKLDGGEVGAVYLVKYSDGTTVVEKRIRKVGEPIEHNEEFEGELQALRAEFKNLQLLEGLGIRAPRAIALHEESGTLVISQIENAQTLGSTANPAEHIPALMAVIADMHSVSDPTAQVGALHEYGPDYHVENLPESIAASEWKKHVVGYAQYWMKKTVESGAVTQDQYHQALAYIVSELEALPEPAVTHALLHGDAHLENYLINEDGIWTIDVPYMKLGDPIYELARFVNFEPEHKDAVQEQYPNKAVFGEEWKRWWQLYTFMDSVEMLGFYVDLEKEQRAAGVDSSKATADKAKYQAGVDAVLYRVAA